MKLPCKWKWCYDYNDKPSWCLGCIMIKFLELCGAYKT